MSVTPADVAVGLGHVHKAYGGDQPVVALDDVSAVFARGTATAVTGASGAGGSTLPHRAAGPAAGPGPGARPAPYHWADGPAGPEPGVLSSTPGRCGRW
ncbi:hypothetical protein ACFXKH_25495 [Streptomyces caelestis]|uniref:hypothetical protein n=1 Tax=Streptomyces caelestis TaxID=36816 RepID=UPI00368BF4ED